MDPTPSRRLRFIVLLLMAAAALTVAPARAEVERVEITSRELFAGGMSFGDTGPYEKIRGRLFYAVDPANLANTEIVDLELAPRGADGKVRFEGDFLLLRPVDLGRGNRRLLYDVNNRGNLYVLRHVNGGARSNDPSSAEDAGNGFLMERGYTLLWSAWNWDVRSGDNRLQIELPVATSDGAPIRQRIAAEMVNSFSTETLASMPLAWGDSRCYPPADLLAAAEAVLTVRDEPTGERQLISRERWRFARIENGMEIPDPTAVTLDGGFEPGRIYELIYETQNPRVVGLGFAAVRDAISFFHFEGADRFGNPSPLAEPDGRGAWRSTTDLAIIFGVSQSGRFITHMLWQGFHVDERDRMVFEGARIHVAGGGKGGFNHRFAQTTHHPSHLEGNLFPADHPPFNFLPDGEPADNDVLAAAKRLGKVPKIIITNNALEYWTRSASLIHTDLTGTRDAPIHPDVRIYMTNGAPHGAAPSRHRTVTVHERNPLGVEAVQRAMLTNLDRWLTAGVEPPPSRVPRIDRGELITAAEHARRFPLIPGARDPGRNLQPPRLDLGPEFWTTGVFSVVPAIPGDPWPTLVPAFDADGNGIGGIRLPELAAPLGTYQGFNPRATAAGAPDYLTRFDGSFWAFPVTEDERRRIGDPRPSLEERYADHQNYVNRVAAVADELVAQRLLLAEDGAAVVELAGRLQWPPEPIDTAPFWRLGDDRVVPTGVVDRRVEEATAVAAASATAATAVEATAVSRAAGVQVSAEPGLRVYLDGQLVGTTTLREDGIYLADVERGRHTIRVEKDGFEPQRYDVQVYTRPIEVEVGSFVPASVAAPEGQRGGGGATEIREVGSLVVTSAPQNCMVDIDGRAQEKTTPQLSIGGLAAGEHTITFSKPGFEPVTSVIVIEPGAEATVHGDLKETKVEVVHEGLGSLRVISTPSNCTVWFRDQIYDNIRMRLNLGKIPAGEYPIMFMMPGRKLATSVLIVDHQKTIVEVSFIKGQEPFVIRRVPE